MQFTGGKVLTINIDDNLLEIEDQRKVKQIVQTKLINELKKFLNENSDVKQLTDQNITNKTSGLYNDFTSFMDMLIASNEPPTKSIETTKTVTI